MRMLWDGLLRDLVADQEAFDERYERGLVSDEEFEVHISRQRARLLPVKRADATSDAALFEQVVPDDLDLP